MGKVDDIELADRNHYRNRNLKINEKVADTSTTNRYNEDEIEFENGDYRVKTRLNQQRNEIYIKPLQATKCSTPVKNYKMNYDDHIDNSNYQNGDYEENRIVKSQSYMTQLQNGCDIKKKVKYGKKEMFKQELKMKRSKSWDINNQASSK